MKVFFWGTRGSLPASFRAIDCREKVFKILEAARGEDLPDGEAINNFIDTKLPFSVAGTYGTNTSCIEIRNDLPTDEYLLCDAGSGIRDFAHQHMISGRGQKPATFHILMTHLHWDHICGFPFFVPAYIPGNRVIFHGYHEEIPDAIKHQMDTPCFPVPFKFMGADIEFDIMPPCQPLQLCGFDITSLEQNHPGKSYGFRFAKDDKCIVHSTDSEHKEDAYDEDYRFLKFFHEADLVIFDAQYSLAEATFTKADWGHSSNVLGVELAARSDVKHLCMFHNEPTATDTELEEFLLNTRMYSEIYHSEHQKDPGAGRFPQKVSLAYDGLEIEV